MAHRVYGGASGASQQRQPWSEQEDNFLMAAVEKYGTQRWSQISKGLIGRTSKACSHRWRTYLQPGVKHTTQEPFSEWEIAVVQEAHKIVGNQWSTIARMLPGRTNAAVKNFWYAHTRRNQKGGLGFGGHGGMGPFGSGVGSSSRDHGPASPVTEDYYGVGDDEEYEEQEGDDGDKECEQRQEEGGWEAPLGYGEAVGALGEAGATAGDMVAFGGAATAINCGGDDQTTNIATAGASDAMGSVGGNTSAGAAPSRPPLRIKLGRGMGMGLGMGASTTVGMAPNLLPPTAASVAFDAMPPPRASVAGGAGSPVLRGDGSAHPSDSGHASYSSCGLQLQGSSQPLQPEQLGLGLGLGSGQQAAGGVAWMMRGSSSGGGGCNNGRDARLGMSRLGSSSMAVHVAEQGGGMMAFGLGAGCNFSSTFPVEHGLRYSDSSCTGTPVLQQPQQLQLQQLAPFGTGVSLPLVCAGGSFSNGSSPVVVDPSRSSSPFAGAAGPVLPAMHDTPPNAFACGTSALGSAAATALGSGPAFCVGASGLVLSAPSRGLSGLLWYGNCGEEALGGAPSAGLALHTLPSRELLMDTFRDMQEQRRRQQQQQCDGLERQPFAIANASAAQQQQQPGGVKHEEVGGDGSAEGSGLRCAALLPQLLVQGLREEQGAGGAAAPGSGGGCGSGHVATPGSKRDRSGLLPMPIMADFPEGMVWGPTPLMVPLSAAGGESGLCVGPLECAGDIESMTKRVKSQADTQPSNE